MSIPIAIPKPSSAAAERLTWRDFEAAFGEALSPWVRQRIERRHLGYHPLTSDERDACVRRMVDVLLDPGIVRAGAHRHGEWESGWGENLDMLDRAAVEDAIVPRYFGKHQIVRFRQQLVRAERSDLEHETVATLRDWVFDQYCRGVEAIYEFGCGTGHNLQASRDVNPEARRVGLDWASSSQGILARLRSDGVDPKITGHKFDFFNPDRSIEIAPGSAVYTFAALEQTGDRFHAFVEYLLASRMKVCFHVEPIAELLDETNLLDYLSIQYFKKRNYLDGLVSHLRKLEAQGRITIHRAQRSHVGSFFIDGYSVVAWSPA